MGCCSCDDGEGSVLNCLYFVENSDRGADEGKGSIFKNRTDPGSIKE